MSRSILDSWSEISPCLDEVLDLEPEKRDAWFADLDARSPHLAASLRGYMAELTGLKARNFMDVAIPARLANTSLSGQRFGAYTLERAIGHGGMGTVWLAQRSDGQFEGQAAVKLLNTALVGHPSERRLAREGRVLAKLQHPNIAHILDAGVVANGQPYLILEYIRGEPIDRFCDLRKLGIRQRILLFLDVLGAVAHAHSHLIVHRDLKPSNILVTADGVVKLLDFGIAALLSPGAQNVTDITHQLPPGLTPGYAAPEQLLGEPITIATDVYALGVLLFVLLTGQHPSLSSGKTRAEWMRVVLDWEAPRLSDVEMPAADRRPLRGDLDNIVAMCLRRLPAERYCTVDQFAEDLRRYLALEPVSARPRSLAYLTKMFARRHRVAVAAALTVAIVTAVAMVITTRQMLEARYQRDQSRYQTQRAETSIDFLTHLMRSDGGPDGPPRNFHERLDLGVEMLKKQYEDDPKFAGRLLVDLADYYRNDGESVRANELYAQAYKLGKRNQDKELVVSAQCSRAYGDAHTGMREGAQERLDEAQKLLDQIPNPDVAIQIECLLVKVNLKISQGDFAAAETLVRLAMAKREQVDGTNEGLGSAMLFSELGAVYRARNQPRDALRSLESAADIYERNGRGRMSAGISTRLAIAWALVDMGEPSRAMEEHAIINQRLRETGGPAIEHVVYPTSRAFLLLRMGRTEDADRTFEGVVERARQAGHPNFLASALLCEANISIQQRQWDRAEAALKEVSVLLADGVGDGHTRTYAGIMAAELALARSDLESARRFRANILELAGYGTAEPQRALLRVLLISSRIALAESAADDLERFARDALHLALEKARGPDTSADVGEALLRIAQARLLANPGADVRSTLERADRCLTNGLGVDHPLTLEVRTLLARAALGG
jgi:eukaryotic-like serine/threonine-protein kinase